MTLDAQPIRFRRLTAEDLPLMHRWLTTDPLLKEIWLYGKEQTLEETQQKYLRYINREKPTEPYLILYGETPIGYIQTYLWRDYPGYNQYLDLTGAASLDLFIGEADYRGRGIGTEMLSRFLRDYVFANPEARSCVITPEAANVAAIHAYAKVGFRHLKTVEGIPDEPGPVYFMGIDRT